MQISGLQIVACLLLFVGTGLVIVAIATQSWSYYDYDHPKFDENVHQFSANVDLKDLPKSGRRGLFKYCYTSEIHKEDFAPDAKTDGKETCKEVFQNFFLNSSMVDATETSVDRLMKSDYQDWDLACLILLCISAALGALTLLTSPCCCNKCGCVLSLFVLLAALCAVAAISVYAYYQDNGLTVQRDQQTYILKKGGFDWSFWCAVSGAACQLLSSVLFAVSRNRMQRYTPVTSSGYHYT